jgi:hypothetical protein
MLNVYDDRGMVPNGQSPERVSMQISGYVCSIQDSIALISQVHLESDGSFGSSLMTRAQVHLLTAFGSAKTSARPALVPHEISPDVSHPSFKILVQPSTLSSE